MAEILFESYAYNRDKLIWVPSSTLADTMLPKGFVVDGCKPVQQRLSSFAALSE
jgi:hypothetical protein